MGLKESFTRLSPKQRFLLIFGWLLFHVVAVLYFVFEDRVMKALTPYAERARSSQYRYYIMGGLVALSSFPPIPGFSTIVLACGFIFGFPLGFAPAFAGAVIGAIGSFWLFRKALAGYVKRLIAKQGKFAALSVAVQEDGFKIIFLLRLSAFPYAFCNALFGSLQTVSFLTFLLTTVLSLPELLIYVFIGSRLGSLSTKNMDKTSKLANYITTAVGILLFIIVALYVHIKTKKIAGAAAKRRSTTINEGLGNDSEVFLRGEAVKIEMGVASRDNENSEGSVTEDERQSFTQENRYSLPR